MSRPAEADGQFRGCDCIVHIAAWHGIHEDRGEKNAYDFFDLNVRGTFEVFEAAACLGIDKVVFISTTSVYRPDTLYGRSKILAELIAEDYRRHRNMNVITLRPRAALQGIKSGDQGNFRPDQGKRPSARVLPVIGH